MATWRNSKAKPARKKTRKPQKEYEYPDETEIDNSYVIQEPAWGDTSALAPGGKYMGRFENVDDAIEAIKKRMADDQYYPSVYRINERGNIDLLNYKGKVLASWF